MGNKTGKCDSLVRQTRQSAGKEERQARKAAALRENLHKRKAQQRARSEKPD